VGRKRKDTVGTYCRHWSEGGELIAGTRFEQHQRRCGSHHGILASRNVSIVEYQAFYGLTLKRTLCSQLRTLWGSSVIFLPDDVDAI
jgi:hypothetical protein